MSDALPRKIPLNDVQQTMLRWNSLHPYNVVDMAEVLFPVDAAKLCHAAETVVGELDLGAPRTDSRGVELVITGGHCRVEVDHVPYAGDLPHALDKQVNREMNRPFVSGKEAAVRLALIEGASGNFVAMTYQHWLMDGVAAARVFRRILERADGRDCPAGSTDEIDTPLYDTAFSHAMSGRQRWAHLKEGVGGLFARSRACTPWASKSPDGPVRFRNLPVPPDGFDRLRALARRHRCTINDALLAAVFVAVDRAIPRRKERVWRNQIAVCNIANLRPLAPRLESKLGVYLAFFGTRLGTVPSDTEALLCAVRDQTTRIKNNRLHLASLATFRTVPRIWNLLPARARAKLLRALFPYSAGLSNLRIGDECAGDPSNPNVRAYARACPLGMMLPLIFGATTMNGELTMTMTWLHGGYSAAQTERMAATLSDLLAGDFRASTDSV